MTMNIFRWIKSLFMCLLLLGMVSCIKDNISGNNVVKTYLYVDVASRVDGSTDPADQIYHLKVCAYNSNHELVGYKEVTQNTDQPIEMDLTESGQITFLVAANEEYGTTEAVSLDYNQFLATKLTGFYKHDDVYVPSMSNPEKKSNGEENRVFTVNENECTNVTIELERAVSRICFYFAKTKGAENLEIKSIQLNRGVGHGYLLPPADAWNYENYSEEQLNSIFATPSGKVMILNESVPVSKVVEESENITVENSQESIKYFVFPCPYGSTNPDEFKWPNGQTYSRDYSYYVNMEYVVDGHSFTKFIYLPTVGQNQNINILCKIPPKNVEVQPEFIVSTVEWANVTNPDIVFD